MSTAAARIPAPERAARLRLAWVAQLFPVVVSLLARMADPDTITTNALIIHSFLKERPGVPQMVLQTFCGLSRPLGLLRARLRSFQPGFDKAADGLWAAYFVSLACDPCVQGGEAVRLQADQNWRALSSWRRPPSFSWLHGFLCHVNYDIIVSEPRGSMNFPPGSNRQHGGLFHATG